MSWHGVLLAEVARLSPPGRIGSTTGAVLAFGDAGALVLPLLFSAALTLTGGYAPGFLIGGAFALAVGLWGVWRRVNRSSESSPVLRGRVGRGRAAQKIYESY